MFVILQPHSNTNPTDNYRVVDAAEWQRYVDLGRLNRDYVIAGEHPYYAEAEAQRDELNAGLIK